MSGLVAALSTDAAVRERAVGRAAWLRRLPTDECLEWHGEGVRVAACGAPRELSVAEEPGGPAAVLAGEILNAAALRRELGAPAGEDGARLALRAYERWGAGLFGRLEGAFALVVADTHHRLVLAGTDPYGVMPLFRTSLGSDVALATEAKLFTADPRFDASLDPEALATAVTLGYELGDGLFAGARGLREGRHLEIRDGRVAEVTHWDPRGSLGALRGGAYVARLADAVQSLAPGLYSGERVLLPLTGGLDSRLLGTVCPEPGKVTAVTFGVAGQADVARGGQIAAALGMEHQVVPYDPVYLSRHAAATVWFTEGRLTPVENITGFQMAGFAAEAFVSGVDSGLGRRFVKGRGFLPDPRILRPDDPTFTGWALPRIASLGMSDEQAELVFGAEGRAMRRVGMERLQAVFGESDGLPGADRSDLYMVSGRARSWRCAGLGLAGTWLTPRAPFFTRSWIDAVLAGAPEERTDDLARVRLLEALGESVLDVPWVMTGLSLRTSGRLLAGLRQASRLRRDLAAALDARSAPGPQRNGHEGAGRRRDGGVLDRARLSAARTARGVYHRFYDYGDDRADWLRGPSRSYVREVLLGERTVARGTMRREGLRRLLDEHDAGVDNSYALSTLLGVELWRRQFEDGDGPPAEVRSLAAGGVPAVA